MSRRDLQRTEENVDAVLAMAEETGAFVIPLRPICGFAPSGLGSDHG